MDKGGRINMTSDLEGLKKEFESVGGVIIAKDAKTGEILVRFSKEDAPKIDAKQIGFTWVITHENKKINPEKFGYILTKSTYSILLFQPTNL